VQIEQHCIGWNRGRNPLPFVLVEDVAAAILAATEADGLDGRCFNLVGEVRPSAREYIASLGAALGRPLRFHPKSPSVLWGEELAKWLVKRAGGRAVPLPSRRDILSRGLEARFDCADAQAALGWRPVADPAVFAARAIRVHA
jgi:nucleoside-diphosphate-sugar epimerase